MLHWLKDHVLMFIVVILLMVIGLVISAPYIMLFGYTAFANKVDSLNYKFNFNKKENSNEQ